MTLIDIWNRYNILLSQFVCNVPNFNNKGFLFYLVTLSKLSDLMLVQIFLISNLFG